MAKLITNTIQLSFFEKVRTSLLSNDILRSKFDYSNIYQYEPHHKSPEFKGFPYIWINIPSTSTDILTMAHSPTTKKFTIDIYLRMDYMARDKFVPYANGIINALESSESDFQLYGYYNPVIDLINVDSNQVIEEKDVVEGQFELTFNGVVER